MARKFSAADRVAALVAQGLTQKAIGRKLGVTDRTVRRWKNESVMPSPTHDRKLSRAAARAREETRESNRRVAGGLPVPRGAVLPRGTRRKIADRDAEGRDLGTKHLSDWVNYKVKGMSRAQIIGILASFVGLPVEVQLLFDAPAVDPYFLGRETHPERWKRKFKRGGTIPEKFFMMTLRDLPRFYDENFGVPGRVPIYVGVTYE